MIGRLSPPRRSRSLEFAPSRLWVPGQAPSMTMSRRAGTEGASVTDRDRAQARVLVVDDEEHITELVAMGLGFNGFEVERAGSGRAALAAIESRRPDLVVLDVMLPDLDGFEVARDRKSTRLNSSHGYSSYAVF